MVYQVPGCSSTRNSVFSCRYCSLFENLWTSLIFIFSGLIFLILFPVRSISFFPCLFLPFQAFRIQLQFLAYIVLFKSTWLVCGLKRNNKHTCHYQSQRNRFWNISLVVSKFNFFNILKRKIPVEMFVQHFIFGGKVRKG